MRGSHRLSLKSAIGLSCLSINRLSRSAQLHARGQHAAPVFKLFWRYVENALVW